MARSWIAAFATLCLFCLQSLPTIAEAAEVDYPVDNVTLITHSSPGGGSDVFLRELVKHLAPIMGVTFAVENVRGGSGAKAMAKVGNAPSDGSMLYATTPTHIQTTILSEPAVGFQDLDPVAVVFFDPEIIFTRAEAPWKDLTEAVAYAKESPNKARWGAANPTSLERMAMERLKRIAGVNVPVVSHEGGGDLIINVLNGTLDLGVGELQELRSQLDAGKIRLLGVLTDKRLDQVPDLKTVKEQGFDLVVRKFRGLAGPKGIPDSVAAAWNKALKAAVSSPEYQKTIAKDGLITSIMTRDEARAFTADFAEEVTGSLRELEVIK